MVEVCAVCSHPKRPWWRHVWRAMLQPKGPPVPPYGTDEFARWLNGDMTKLCGHGYHEGGAGIVCNGTVNTSGIECPCLCECHQ